MRKASFGGKCSVNFPQKIGLKFVTENFTIFFTARKEICHLELSLGASSPNCIDWRGKRLHGVCATTVVTGKSLDSPEKGNVDKMSEKCQRNVRKMSKNCPEPEGLKTQFSDILGTMFVYLVDVFVWRPCPTFAHYNTKVPIYAHTILVEIIAF